jgi:hypothetical protein
MRHSLTILAKRGFGACLTIVLALGSTGCLQTVEPGEDLPEESPPANLGPEIDTGADITAESGTDITGTFDVSARVTSSFGGEAVDLGFVAEATQMGDIETGEATVDLTIWQPDAGKSTSGSTDMPAAISQKGKFAAEITGLTLPADSSEMLNSDVDADVTLDSQIVDSDCFQGEITVTMKDVDIGSGNPIPELDLTGPFEAPRQGASCDSSSNADAGDTRNSD